MAHNLSAQLHPKAKFVARSLLLILFRAQTINASGFVTLLRFTHNIHKQFLMLDKFQAKHTHTHTNQNERKKKSG